MEKNILYKKIRDKRATLREQYEFMEFLHEDGVITDEHYRRFCAGEDRAWLLSLARLSFSICYKLNISKS